MKVSINWLRDYVDIDVSAEQVAEILSDLGMPCEGIEHTQDDVIIDVEVTSNRGDCLGHIGIARELAAATGKELKLPKVSLVQSQKQADDLVSVEICNPNLCGRYTARVIEGIKVGPTPEPMKKRLEAVGLRSVNNVVDATNYAMMETGQPPHAFDYEKIAGGKIIVRKAVAGEQITSIDGTKCDLSTDMLIIADGNGPVAIAGVMGGLDTEVSDSTVSVLLEDAYFDPVSVRTTSRKLALPSEAAFRFERIVDIERIDWASQRTAQLIVQVAGGSVANGVVDIYPNKAETKKVTLRLERLRKLLGIEIPAKRVIEILSALCFEPKRQGEAIFCTVPSWRSDIYREVDLIEEVARVHGYDKVPTEEKINITVAAVDKRQRLSELVGRFLNSCGFFETINVTFAETSTAKVIAGGDSEHLAVNDVSRKSSNLLRQSLIGSLLGVLKLNYNAGNLPCKVYELANTFKPTDGASGELPIEKTKLGLVCDGRLRDIRGVIEGLVDTLDRDAQVTFAQGQVPWANVGAEIRLNEDTVIGCMGIVSQQVRNEFDLKDMSVCAAELDFERLIELETKSKKIKPIPRFPAVVRDLSIIVDEQTTWADITAAIKRKSSRQLEKVDFAGIYRGRPIAEDKKSVTISLRFRDEDGTLTHEAVDQLEKAIVQELHESLSAELRDA